MKKMMSILLVVALVFAISPLNVSALTVDKYFRVESKNLSYGTLQEALANAQDTDTIVVTSNMVLDAPVFITKNITIKSDFKTVNVVRNFEENSATITVANGATLTLKNVSFDGDRKTVAVEKGGLISVSNGGKLVLNNKSILKGSSLAAENTYGGAVFVKRYGCLVDNGCQYSDNSAAVGENSYWVPASKTNSSVDLVRMKKCMASNLKEEPTFIDHFAEYNLCDDAKLDVNDMALIIEGLLGI